VFANLQARRLAVVGCEWEVLPKTDGPQDVRIADFVRSVLEETNFDQGCFEMLQGLLTGYKVIEIMWRADGGGVRIEEFRGREPHRFGFGWDDNPRLLTMENPIEGEPLPDHKFMVFRFGASSHNPYGLGLGYRLYWPVWFKKNAIKFWMVFAEKFGSPTGLGKYPPTATGAERDKLLEAIDSIQQETGVIIPQDMTIEFLEAARSSSVNTYADLCEFMNRAIAKVILGQTLTTETSDSGTYGLGRVQNEVRLDIVKADADALCEALNRQAVRWICDFNFPPSMLKNGYPKIWRRVEPERDLKQLAERDRIVLKDLGLGASVPLSYLAETYNIPLARKKDKVIGRIVNDQETAGKHLG
jgi:phage gp29-like protein